MKSTNIFVFGEKYNMGFLFKYCMVDLHDFLLNFLQKQKQMEILKIEQEFQEMHLKEIAMQEANKASRLKVM